MINEFTLKIQIGLSQEAADILRGFVSDDMPCQCGQAALGEEFEQRVTDIVVRTIKQLSKHTKPEETPGKAVEDPAPKPEENHEDAASQDAASGPGKPEGAEITDAQLREVVKAAKDRTSTKSIKEVFADFGIKVSTECPQERRSELVDRLENLK